MTPTKRNSLLSSIPPQSAAPRDRPCTCLRKIISNVEKIRLLKKCWIYGCFWSLERTLDLASRYHDPHLAIRDTHDPQIKMIMIMFTFLDPSNFFRFIRSNFDRSSFTLSKTHHRTAVSSYSLHPIRIACSATWKTIRFQWKSKCICSGCWERCTPIYVMSQAQRAIQGNFGSITLLVSADYVSTEQLVNLFHCNADHETRKTEKFRGEIAIDLFWMLSVVYHQMYREQDWNWEKHLDNHERDVESLLFQIEWIMSRIRFLCGGSWIRSLKKASHECSLN